MYTNKTADELMTELDVLNQKFEEAKDKIREEGKTPWNTLNPYYKPINELVEVINQKLMEGEKIYIQFHACSGIRGMIDYLSGKSKVVKTISFTSDKEGNYYFDDNKVTVVYDGEWACHFTDKIIRTNERRPIGFFLTFLHPTGIYGTGDNPFFPSRTGGICAKVLSYFLPPKKKETQL